MALLSPSQKRKLDEILTLNPPSEAEIFACQIKVIQEVREMFQSGTLRYDKVDPDLMIPENIEETLNKGGVASTASFNEQQVQNLILAASKEASSEAGGPSPAAVMLVEEMKELRKKLQSCLHELHTSQKENQILKDKLDQIRKIA